MRCLLVLLVCMDGVLCLAQSFATDRIVGLGNVPLSIVNASPVGQPLRLFTGSGGGELGLEISSAADVSIPRRLGIGNGVGASSLERVRIGRIDLLGGIGLAIDMDRTDTATGIRVQHIGASGSHHAGIVLTSDANGVGTGIRIGGPAGGLRPTLGTGIDIIGGTGLRYNALTAGEGTAIDIGSTVAPRRGVDVTASGSEHIGGLFRANMLGTGIVGLSMSASYADPVHTPRTGVRGVAASNSNTAADVITGVLGHVQRGGNGGTNTTSIAVDALAESNGMNHAGLVIGVRAMARSTDAGTAGAIALLADVEPSPMHMAIGVRRGDTYLGSSLHDLPPALPLTFSHGIMPNASVTRMYDARISGSLSLVGIRSRVAMTSVGTGDLTMRWASTMPVSGTVLRVMQQDVSTVDVVATPLLGMLRQDVLPAGVPSVPMTDGIGVLRIMADPLGSILAGLSVGSSGATVMVIAVQGILTIVNEFAGIPPAEHILTANGADVQIDGDGAASFWYDSATQRWRLLQYVP